MIIDDDRQPFDDLLKDSNNTFLLLFGTSNPLALKIHDKAIEPDVVEEWNKTVLFRNLDKLTPVERAAWYVNDDNYSTLSRRKESLPDAAPTPHKRKVVEQAPLDNLCVKGEPSPRKISAAFGRADKA